MLNVTVSRRAARVAGVELNADDDDLRRIVAGDRRHRAVEVDGELLPVVVLGDVRERPAELVLDRDRDGVDLRAARIVPDATLMRTCIVLPRQSIGVIVMLFWMSTYWLAPVYGATTLSDPGSGLPELDRSSAIGVARRRIAEVGLTACGSS